MSRVTDRFPAPSCNSHVMYMHGLQRRDKCKYTRNSSPGTSPLVWDTTNPAHLSVCLLFSVSSSEIFESLSYIKAYSRYLVGHNLLCKNLLVSISPDFQQILLSCSDVIASQQFSNFLMLQICFFQIEILALCLFFYFIIRYGCFLL